MYIYNNVENKIIIKVNVISVSGNSLGTRLRINLNHMNKLIIRSPNITTIYLYFIVFYPHHYLFYHLLFQITAH